MACRLRSCLPSAVLIHALLCIATSKHRACLPSCTPPCSGFLADYGAPLMLLAFSGLSFAVHGGGSGGGSVPRRVQTPNVWDASSNWSVAAVSRTRGDSVPGAPACRRFPSQLRGRWVAVVRSRCPAGAQPQPIMQSSPAWLLARAGHGQSGGPLDRGGAERPAFFWSRQPCVFTIYHPMQDMASLEGRWIAAALIPAALITVLFFFDHNVSAQLAQQVSCFFLPEVVVLHACRLCALFWSQRVGPAEVQQLAVAGADCNSNSAFHGSTGRKVAHLDTALLIKSLAPPLRPAGGVQSEEATGLPLRLSAAGCAEWIPCCAALCCAELCCACTA